MPDNCVISANVSVQQNIWTQLCCNAS